MESIEKRGVVHFHRSTRCTLPHAHLSRPQTCQFKVLPFGLSLSPRVFTRVVGAALSPLQVSGIKILLYLDGWLICVPSLSQVVEDTRKGITYIQSLSFKVNAKKSNLKTRHQVVFAGLCLNSLTMLASFTPQRVMKILALLDLFRLVRQLEMIQ